MPSRDGENAYWALTFSAKLTDNTLSFSGPLERELRTPAFPKGEHTYRSDSGDVP
jgi:hypothetical protein